MAESPKERFQQLLFYALVLLMAYLALLVLSPFLASLAWAAVFAMMFHGVFRELVPRMGANRAALATTLMAAILIVARETGVVNQTKDTADSGAITAYQSIVSASGELEGTTGHFFVSGFSRDGRIVTKVTGRVCRG